MYFLEHSGTILFQNIGNIFHFLYQSAPFNLVFRSKFFFFFFLTKFFVPLKGVII